MATDDKAADKSVIEQLREIANKLEKFNHEKLSRSGLVCCLLAPCDHEEHEGHNHSQVTIVIGGNTALCASAHRDLTSALVQAAPGPMFAGLLTRLHDAFQNSEKKNEHMN